MNYFFEVVYPQLLKYFENKDEELVNLLVIDVLKDNPKYLELISEVKTEIIEEL